MKRPHEGIRGVDRGGDDFLSLDLRAVAHRDVIGALVEHLHTACLVGNPAPVVRDMYSRMRTPVVGDLVQVTDWNHPGGQLGDRVPGLGYLVEHRAEWWHTDTRWEQHLAAGDYTPDDDRPVEDVWYIQYGPNPGDVYRWHNCTVLAVPWTWRQFDTAGSCNCRQTPTVWSGSHQRAAPGCRFDVPPPGSRERAHWTWETASTTQQQQMYADAHTDALDMDGDCQCS